MAITRIALRGPTNNSNGNLGLSWGTSPARGNLLVLHIMALSGQTLPTSISGWTTVFTNGTGGGYVSAVYTRIASGTEAGTFNIMTATTATNAWVNEYNTDQGGKAVALIGSYGGDSDDGSTGIVTTSVASLTTAAGYWIELGTVWASSSPSFPTVPAAPTGRSITQTGASLGTIQNRAAATWQTNHRYNISDIPVTTGATAPVKYVADNGTSNLRGLSNMNVLYELTANTAPTSSATVPSSANASSTYTVTDTSTVTTGGATIVSRVWRIVSGGGSLSSTSSSAPTVTAPSAAGTQVIGITATDSNGLAGSEATYNVTINAAISANAGPDQTVDSLSTVTMAGSGTGITFVWRQISGTTAALSSTSVQNPTLKAPATVAGDTLVYGLKSGDGSGGYGPEDTVNIIVLPQTEWKLIGGTWTGSNVLLQ